MQTDQNNIYSHAKPSVIEASRTSLYWLCLCMGYLACAGSAATATAFAFFCLPEAPGSLLSAVGFSLMGLPLVFLPGIFAGDLKRMPVLIASGILALAILLITLPERENMYIAIGLFSVYAAALGGVLKFPAQNRPAQVLRLRRMVVWTLAIAVLFSLMATGMLHENAVSERVTFGGYVVAGASVLSAFCAFCGTMRPALFSTVIYVSLLLLWLMVPVVGMEAYMYESLPLKSFYAKTDWKWTYLFCVIGVIAALRLLILRQDLLRPPLRPKA